MTGVTPVSSTYTPTLRFTLWGRVSARNASERPRIGSGAAGVSDRRGRATGRSLMQVDGCCKHTIAKAGRMGLRKPSAALPVTRPLGRFRIPSATDATTRSTSSAIDGVLGPTGVAAASPDDPPQIAILSPFPDALP